MKDSRKNPQKEPLPAPRKWYMNRWLQGVSAVAVISGYVTFAYYNVQPDPRDLIKIELTPPSQETGTLDQLIERMKAAPQNYSSLYVVVDPVDGHATHVWLRGKRLEHSDEYARVLTPASADDVLKVLKAYPEIWRDSIDDPAVAKRLKEQLEAANAGGGFPWLSLLLTAAMVGVAVYFVRQVNKFSGGRDNKTTKSKAVRVDHTGKTLDDFEGDHNIKDEIRNLVSFLKDPSRAKRLGAKIPRGTLLVGPPGTGKTLLAKAIAGEANVPFFSLSGSDFVEMFVGVGSARVRDMFEEAKKAAPCIIFIDELDAVGRHRGAGLGGGNDEREQTLNQLLVEMDGFGTDTDVIVIAATNRHDILDPALLRPGRFDLTLSVSNPDRNGRYRILQVHARNKPLTEEARDYLKELAAKTPGFSGADLEGVLNHAALVRLYRIYREEDVLRKQAQELETRLLAEGKTEDETKSALAEADLSPEKILLRLPPEEISVADVLEGKWRVIAGTRGDREQTEDELLNTAVHEILHAFISEKDYQENNGGQPVREVNCIQRQRALGVTVTTPDHDAVSTSDVEIRAKVRMGMGGRAGQKVILGRIDSGAANDFEQATSLLREYVMRFGMDEEIGPLHVGESGGQPFLGKSMGAARQSTIGEDLANLIDRRMQFWSKQLMFEAETIAAENKTMLLAMAKELLQDEEWTRKEWLAQLRKHGCDKLFGWRLDYGEPRYDFVAQPVIV